MLKNFYRNSLFQKKDLLKINLLKNTARHCLLRRIQKKNFFSKYRNFNTPKIEDNFKEYPLHGPDNYLFLNKVITFSFIRYIENKSISNKID